MQIRLHDRSDADAGHAGLSCDEGGLLFGGDHALIEAREGPFGRVFRRRPLNEINRLLSAGYGIPIDLAEREPLLDRIRELARWILFSLAAVSIAAGQANAACPIERARYVMTGEPNFTAGFWPTAKRADWPSDLALFVRFRFDHCAAPGPFQE